MDELRGAAGKAESVCGSGMVDRSNLVLKLYLVELCMWTKFGPYVYADNLN